MKTYSTLDNPKVVPVQQFAYRLACQVAVEPGDAVLDVGFGLGYGLSTVRRVASRTVGVEIDERAVALAYITDPTLSSFYAPYDGLHLPFGSASFDVATCIDVLEHVQDYQALIAEMVRVAWRAVFISTPRRRPENTNRDGTPTNYWHLREWEFHELRDILRDYTVDWHFINRDRDGAYSVGPLGGLTQALAPVIRRAA